VGSEKRERQRQGRQARLAAEQAAQQRRQRFRTARNFGIIIVVIIIALFVLSRYNSDDKQATSTSSSGAPSTTPTTGSAAPAAFTYGTGACPNLDGSSPRTIDFTQAPQQCIDPTKTYTATFDTTAGKVVVKLDTTTTPGTANNFVVLARYHYYDNTRLFRTAQSIGIIQGGSPHDNTASDQGPGYNLPDEGFDYAAINGTGGPYKYALGDLIMARTPAPNGASAQFFFGASDNVQNLNSQGVYVKFGSATEGVDVLQKILASAPQDESPPNPPVTINTVTITES
jgi:cyclophilin family peptidyl-prolyl cis-trans isomerase